MVEIELLREASLFSGCPDEDLVYLSDIARDREFQDGDLLFAAGEEAQELMVVASGNVQLEFPVAILADVRNIAFETKGRGDVVGWSTLAEPHRFTLNGRARGTLHVASFARSDLTGLLSERPELHLRVLDKLVTTVRLRLDRTQMMWRHEIQQSIDRRFR